MIRADWMRLVVTSILLAAVLYGTRDADKYNDVQKSDAFVLDWQKEIKTFQAGWHECCREEAWHVYCMLGLVASSAEVAQGLQGAVVGGRGAPLGVI